MKKHLRTVCSILFFAAAAFAAQVILFSMPAHAATVFLSGTTTTASTWTANNVYVIQNSFTIGSGGTITVNSSTIVKFSSGAYLDVAASGTLKANGVSAGKIYFTSY